MPNYSDHISHYIIEIEVPRVKDVSKLKIQWLDNTTLSAQGETENVEQAVRQNNNTADEHSEEHSKARDWPYVVIGERRFTLPAQTVHASNISAKLKAGLLTLKIPKHRLHLVKAKETVKIEYGD